MVRCALFLHGTDGDPENFWFPSLKEAFQHAGYDVEAPLLPDNHTPNKEVYDTFIRRQNYDVKDAVLVGHSSGATTVLNLLQSEWMPHVRACVLAGVFLNEKLTKQADWYEEGQFDNLFPEEFDVDALHSKCNTFYFVHGDNDPSCSCDDAKEFCEKLGGTFITIPNGDHLATTSGITELPSLVEQLRVDGLLS